MKVQKYPDCLLYFERNYINHIFQIGIIVYKYFEKQYKPIKQFTNYNV